MDYKSYWTTPELQIQPSTLEQAVPTFTGALTTKNIEDIEQVQKLAFKIILRGKYKDYNNALEILEEKTLEERRKELTLKFAKKCQKHPIMKGYFNLNNNGTRSGDTYTETLSLNARLYNEPINYMTRLLNENIAKNNEKKNMH